MRRLEHKKSRELREELGISRSRLHAIRHRVKGQLKRETAERLAKACRAVLGEDWPPESFIWPERYPENWLMERD